MSDGNRMLPIAAKLMEDNPQLNAVFVGIGYPTEDKDEIVRLRYFDLTPSTPDELIPVQTNIPKTGGRDAFFDFIDHQVKAEVEKRFAIDKNKQALLGIRWVGFSRFMRSSIIRIHFRLMLPQTHRSGGMDARFSPTRIGLWRHSKPIRNRCDCLLNHPASAANARSVKGRY